MKGTTRDERCNSSVCASCSTTAPASSALNAAGLNPGGGRKLRHTTNASMLLFLEDFGLAQHTSPSGNSSRSCE
eukprot:CAMPEP_0119115496 /NCGR_PEP_ID=MMETSP1180-20130426/51166_1 /TAXON_ID=3052 ORGANISM="Chlamydomonas cf sp, Strain CCMP681" /NCGR_SAMPLE_ID=MMETSP1180 /ASSEMBLY_ACC=CAM_ASM_000741 /LENGTH=73 /DNA_ID=CAMNT_0007104503 /DNA_START=429 /DNA_END=650 /DNA_ORIENTATION=-